MIKINKVNQYWILSVYINITNTYPLKIKARKSIKIIIKKDKQILYVIWHLQFVSNTIQYESARWFTCEFFCQALHSCLFRIIYSRYYTHFITVINRGKIWARNIFRRFTGTLSDETAGQVQSRCIVPGMWEIAGESRVWRWQSLWSQDVIVVLKFPYLATKSLTLSLHLSLPTSLFQHYRKIKCIYLR